MDAEVDVAIPSLAASFPFNMESRTVGVCCDGRGRVVGDAQREGADDINFFEFGIVVLAVLLCALG